MSDPRYSVLIQWSEEDKCFIASFPEWSERAFAHTHGATYEECARNAAEVLELLMDGEANLPAPRYFEADPAPPASADAANSNLQKRSA